MIFSSKEVADHMRRTAREQVLDMMLHVAQEVDKAHNQLPEDPESRERLLQNAVESIYHQRNGVFQTLLYRSGYVFGDLSGTVVDCVTFYDNQPLDIAKQMIDAGGLRGGIDLNTGQIHT